jgi:hypothetical protein
MTVIYLWVINIYKFKINNFDEINNELIKTLQMDHLYVKTDWNAKLSNVIMGRGKHVKLFKMLQREMIKVISVVPELVNLNPFRCGNFKCENDCSDMWLNTYNYGDFQGVHTHLDSSPLPRYSFTYFAKYDENKDSNFVVGNPTTTNQMYDGCLEITEKKYLDVHQGEVIFFPSYLPHYVEKQENHSERITISGNFFDLKHHQSCGYGETFFFLG